MEVVVGKEYWISVVASVDTNEFHHSDHHDSREIWEGNQQLDQSFDQSWAVTSQIGGPKIGSARIFPTLLPKPERRKNFRTSALQRFRAWMKPKLPTISSIDYLPNFGAIFAKIASR
jgi:hypothetical protein